MKTAIITGGTIDCTFIQSYLEAEKPDYLIASDSGIHYFAQTGTAPDEILGDFDSANLEELEIFRNNPDILFHKFPSEKDETDTELALNLALKQGSREIHILGATGTRLDHVLGNIQLLGIANKAGVPCYMVDVHNRLQLLSPGKTFLRKESQYGNYVSLLPLTTEVKGLTLTGFQYPLENHTLGSFNTLGISNRIVQKEAVIMFTEGVLIEIESRD